MKLINSSGIVTDLIAAPLEPGMFGDGSDGDVTLNTGTGPTWVSGMGPYTLTRSVFARNLTLTGAGALNTAGFRIFCTGTLSIATFVSNNGGNGVGGGSGGTSGSGGLAAPAGDLGSSGAGGAGGTGSAGAGVSGSPGGNVTSMSSTAGGGAGGTGGGPGGTSGSPGVATARPFRSLSPSLFSLGTPLTGGAGAGGGGSGLGAPGNVAAGGGGGGGRVIMIFAQRLQLLTGGQIRAMGGDGGAGGSVSVGTGKGGAGGGGGGGGVIYAVYSWFSSAVATPFLVSGGTKGGLGTPNTGGAEAVDGSPGTILRYNASFKQWE
ncbi:MAG: hypothetical protein JNN07_19935 [Verrucomicrobiales bacterium]|nr:hypothetical protein [Verrucomicrobiales bacterium]